MIKFMRSAVVVIACLAGLGAWATKVDVAPTYTYASELFGAGHEAIEYGEAGNPMVVLTIPGNTAEDTTVTPNVPAGTMGSEHNGATEITFMLTKGVFDANITRLMFDNDGPSMHGDGGNADVLCSTNVADGTPADSADTADTGCNAATPAAGAVASIVSGGKKGENYIKIKIEEATDGGAATRDETLTDDSGRNADHLQTISFEMPELDELTGLAGAGDTADKLKTVKLMATSRIISGAFTDGALVKNAKGMPDGKVVIYSQNAVSVSISGVAEHMIAIDDSKDGSMGAFMHLMGANKMGYVKLADVMITTATERVISEGKDDTDPAHVYNITSLTDTAATERIFSLMEAGSPAMTDSILDLNGEEIDAGLRGTLTISASGSRGLFNEGDAMFIDYDADGEAGDSEGIDIDGDMGEGTALSIDPDDSESFDGGTGTFSVYYMAGGKDAINHGSMIKVTASVDYSDPSAINEGAKNSTTSLNFAGVGSPIMAYAIPHSSNGIGDKGNVRVRCEEAPAGDAEACRVFLECWDQMGNRGFGEAPNVGENMTAVWDGAAIEGVADGLDEPDSRISCRVLSKGMVTVQQLTRDGNSGTLVNNTYVGESD